MVAFDGSKDYNVLAQKDSSHDLEHSQALNRRDKIWTEITKDLVNEEALKTVGYEFEETDDFFYVMDYLNYVSI